MSGAMRKIGEYLGLLEDTGRYDDEYGDDFDTSTDAAPVAPAGRAPGSASPVPPPFPTSPSAVDRPRSPPPEW